jgi:hypothetical protein
VDWFVRHRAELVADHVTAGPTSTLLSLVSPSQLPHILTRMLDEQQFLSPFGIRSLSKEHEASPYHFESRMSSSATHLCVTVHRAAAFV